MKGTVHRAEASWRLLERFCFALCYCHSGSGVSSPPTERVILQLIRSIKALPSIFTAAVLTSAWSAGNTYLYIGSRILVSLSLDHTAPQVFARVSKRGVPYYAVMFTALLGLLAYLCRSSPGDLLTVSCWVRGRLPGILMASGPQWVDIRASLG